MSDDDGKGGFMNGDFTDRDFTEGRRDPGFADRDVEPGEFDRVERRLRRDLRSDALRIEPGERLGAILSEARSGAARVPRQLGFRRWLAPVAAAAAVALVAGGAWLATRGGSAPAPPPAGTSTSPAPTTLPSASSPASSSGTPTTPPVGTALALPAYFVGATGEDGGFGLYREFMRASVPATTDDAKALAAVALAMQPQALTEADGYLQPWSSTRVQAVSVTSSRITVTLSGPGAGGLAAEVQRLAVQQLVWTAQAAVGKGTIPVTFRLGDGSSALFGRFPAAGTYNRPPTSEYYKDLAPVWVTAPSRGQVLRAGTTIHVTGEACVFEATVQWSVTRGPAPVRSGTTMASIGAPSRGTWSVDLAPLDAGTYTVSAWWNSPKDGSVLDRTSVTFTVR